jgi:hypothetical protein
MNGLSCLALESGPPATAGGSDNTGGSENTDSADKNGEWFSE